MSDNAYKTGKAIYNWLRQFAPAYRGVLPAGEETEDLYLQFNGYFSNFAEQFILPVQIYKLNTTSYASVLRIADEIKEAVGNGGVLVVDEETRVKIDLGSPFYQDKPDEDETVRAGYINLLVTVY